MNIAALGFLISALILGMGLYRYHLAKEEQKRREEEARIYYERQKREERLRQERFEKEALNVLKDVASKRNHQQVNEEMLKMYLHNYEMMLNERYTQQAASDNQHLMDDLQRQQDQIQTELNNQIFQQQNTFSNMM